MAKTLNVQQFMEIFPDDDACLTHLMQTRYGDELDCPKCGRNSKFHRLRKEPAYACQWCGHRIYPMAGTPFKRTHTPLQKWFYAMYLFTTSRHGVPAKELQRQLGVTYKTAWRIGHEIRKHMAETDGNDPLSGHVEIDETNVGGKREGVDRRRRNAKGKTIVFGMVAREGDLITHVVPDIRGKSLLPLIEANVVAGSTISTDELHTYGTLGKRGYKHGKVKHQRKQYVDGIHHTNSIEGFWSQLKRSIRGTHIHVSQKHLPKYLGEFEFRYNLRKEPEIMFRRLLSAF